MVLIKQFQDDEKGGVLHGIIGLVTCGLWTLIWGWIHHEKHYIKNLMLMWTIGIVIQIVAGGVVVWLAVSAAKDQLQGPG